MRGVLARDESMEVLLVAEADANAIYSDDLRSSSSSLRTQMKKRMTKVVGCVELLPALDVHDFENFDLQYKTLVHKLQTIFKTVHVISKRDFQAEAIKVKDLLRLLVCTHK